jgi:hypothetical protein
MYRVCVDCCELQLGNGLNVNVLAPPETDVLIGVAAVSAGNEHTCALMISGGLRCWGRNNNGQVLWHHGCLARCF